MCMDAQQHCMPAPVAGPGRAQSRELVNDSEAIRTAVALAIAKSRCEARARSSREEALINRLKRLKSGMAILVKILQKKSSSGSTATSSVLENLLVALEADAHPAGHTDSQDQHGASKRRRTSQATCMQPTFPVQPHALHVGGGSGLQDGHGAASLSQLSQLPGSTACLHQAASAQCHNPEHAGMQHHTSQQQGSSEPRPQHNPFHPGQIIGDVGGAAEGITRAAKEADACLAFCMQAADVDMLRDRTGQESGLTVAAASASLACRNATAASMSLVCWQARSASCAATACFAGSFLPLCTSYTYISSAWTKRLRSLARAPPGGSACGAAGRSCSGNPPHNRWVGWTDLHSRA